MKNLILEWQLKTEKDFHLKDDIHSLQVMSNELKEEYKLYNYCIVFWKLNRI
jgi:hypothetical protein